jgi:hypothetical protein
MGQEIMEIEDVAWLRVMSTLVCKIGQEGWSWDLDTRTTVAVNMDCLEVLRL